MIRSRTSFVERRQYIVPAPSKGTKPVTIQSRLFVSHFHPSDTTSQLSILFIAARHNQLVKCLSSWSQPIRYGFLAIYGYQRIPPTLTTAVPRLVFPHLSHTTSLSPAFPILIGSEIRAVTHFLGLPAAICLSLASAECSHH